MYSSGFTVGRRGEINKKWRDCSLRAGGRDNVIVLIDQKDSPVPPPLIFFSRCIANQASLRPKQCVKKTLWLLLVCAA